MDKRIIYQTEDGGVAVIVPLADSGLTLEQIALKDVPHGLPYKIVDLADVPSDRTFRNAWEVDAALLTDGVGADYGVGTDKTVYGWNEDGTPSFTPPEPVPEPPPPRPAMLEPTEQEGT